MGKLIAIEGLDGSGKETQTGLLYDRLQKDLIPIRRASFPNYAESSSAAVKIYLSGELGEKAEDVNPYAASAFFAVDRFIAYKKHYEAFYASGGVLLCDRYTTSNAPYNGAKIEPARREEFFAWLYEFEFTKMALPRPDAVFYLDMPVGVSQRLIKSRKSKMDGGEKKDIHERDESYLTKCREAAREAARYYGWEKIACADGELLRSEQEIAAEIYSKVKKILNL